MPGYERSKIIGVTDQELDEFICGICLGLFADPVVTQCCRQTYCKDCIKEWVSLHRNCPNDRKILTKKGLKPVPRVLVNLIDNMKIKCNFESEGCSQVVRIGELSNHLTVCDFRPNQLCKTCGLIKESVLTHNCIQSLISEKQKTDEKYLQLLDENSSLLLFGREKDELIGSIRNEHAQSKIHHQRAVDKLKFDHARSVREIKVNYARIFEELRYSNAIELDRLKTVTTKQEQRISELNWDLSDLSQKLTRTQRNLNSELKQKEKLKKDFNNSNDCLGLAVKALVICAGICLYQYFNK